MATLQDIADVVGVSTVTVSKVLRGKVKGSYARSAKQAQRIRQVADELGYRVDWRARALKTKRTHMIGLLSTDKRETRTHEPRLLEGLVQMLGDAGYHLVFVRVGGGGAGDDFADARFDGVIIDYHLEPEEIEVIQQNNLPAVIINAPSVENIPSVMPNHRLAGRLAAEHLLKLGHRRLGYVQAAPVEQKRWPDHMVKRWRLGMLDAMREAGHEDGLVDVIPDVAPGAPETGEAYGPALQRLFSADDRPTALVANNPFRSDIVLHHLDRLGLECPRDVSLLSMGDREGLNYGRPSITCIDLPFEAMGDTAARLLIHQIEAAAVPPTPAEATPGHFPVRLITRQSTAAVPSRVLRLASPDS